MEVKQHANGISCNADRSNYTQCADWCMSWFGSCHRLYLSGTDRFNGRCTEKWFDLLTLQHCLRFRSLFFAGKVMERGRYFQKAGRSVILSGGLDSRFTGHRNGPILYVLCCIVRFCAGYGNRHRCCNGTNDDPGRISCKFFCINSGGGRMHRSHYSAKFSICKLCRINRSVDF